MTAYLHGTDGVIFPDGTSLASRNDLFGYRNKIINGKMDVAQRGTSFAAIGNAYSLDRWSRFSNTTSVSTVSQQSDVPSNNEFQSSLRSAVTTADASIAAGESESIFQLIEGYNVRDLIGKTFTLSFWVRSSKTGVHCAAFVNSGVDRSYVVEYTVNAANTWEQKSVTVSGGLITAGTWNWTNGIGLRVVFTLAAGSTSHTTAGAWQTGNFVATANQVNCLDTIGNIFAITGVQLEVGSVATPFEHRPYGLELQLARRYGRPMPSGVLGQAFSASTSGHSMYLDTPMRATPNFSTTSGYVVSTAGGGTVSATPAIGSLNDNLLYITTSGASSLTAGNATILNAPAGAFLSCEL